MNTPHNNKIHSDPQPDSFFDGHLERPLAGMSATERLEWLWRQRQMRKWIRQNVRTSSDGGGDTPTARQ